MQNQICLWIAAYNTENLVLLRSIKQSDWEPWTTEGKRAMNWSSDQLTSKSTGEICCHSSQCAHVTGYMTAGFHLWLSPLPHSLYILGLFWSMKFLLKCIYTVDLYTCNDTCVSFLTLSSCTNSKTSFSFFCHFFPEVCKARMQKKKHQTEWCLQKNKAIK